MEQRVSLVTLGVRDLERARAFYADGLGWTPAAIGEGTVWFFQLPGMVLALWPRAELAKDAGLEDAVPKVDGPEKAGPEEDGTPGAFAGVALAYNTRSREEVDAVLAEAAAAGGRLVKPGGEAFWGGYTGYFADPDGHLWEVAWNPGFALDEAGRVTLPR